MCMSQMMALDAAGGPSEGSGARGARRLNTTARGLKEGNEAPGATFPASGRPPNTTCSPRA